MSRKSLITTALLTMTIAAAGNLARAQDYSASFDYDRDSGILLVTLDDSHDLVLIGTDGDRVEIDVLMFDPAEFSNVPLKRGDHDDEAADGRLEEFAVEVREHRRLLDSLSRIIVYCRDGHDEVYTLPDVFIPLELHGELGHDLLAAGNGDDDLFGGPGTDALLGCGGDDYLDGAHDGCSDYLEGGDEGDTFVQYYQFLAASSSGGGTFQLTSPLTRSPWVQSGGTPITWRLRVEEERIRDATDEDEVVDGD
jgi:Ca2+-binding RTX toxin-like protein